MMHPMAPNLQTSQYKPVRTISSTHTSAAITMQSHPHVHAQYQRQEPFFRLIHCIQVIENIYNSNYYVCDLVFGDMNFID
jgi:hypothetical protein